MAKYILSNEHNIGIPIPEHCWIGEIRNIPNDIISNVYISKFNYPDYWSALAFLQKQFIGYSIVSVYDYKYGKVYAKCSKCHNYFFIDNPKIKTMEDLKTYIFDHNINLSNNRLCPKCNEKELHRKVLENSLLGVPKLTDKSRQTYYPDENPDLPPFIEV